MCVGGGAHYLEGESRGGAGLAAMAFKKAVGPKAPAASEAGIPLTLVPVPDPAATPASHLRSPWEAAGNRWETVKELPLALLVQSQGIYLC